MKKFLLVILLFIFACIANADEQWFPYYFPADPATAPDYQGVPASVFNAGKEVLDPPAGKHGFVKVKDGHFYFEDGTRAKFWGTNLCFSACFPDKKQAEIIANRIAYFGFNAVRLHHMDSHLEPNGIFEDVTPTFKDKILKPTGHLSPQQLDKLDYFIYQLKQRGIYININTLVSRHFTRGDKVFDAERLGMAAKPVCMFDKRLIELQKKYAKDLLTHFNPYTKLRYCDDPAICLVEIINESTLADFNKTSITAYYQKEFDELFNNWLVAKYGSIEKAKEAWPKSSSSLFPNIKEWQMEQHQGAVMTKEIKNDEVTLNIKNVTSTNWHLQYEYNKAQLKKGKSYILKFTAKADHPLKIGVVSQQAYEPWENLGLHGSFQLEKNFQTFEAPFIATADCYKAKVGFIVGGSPGTITLKDVYFYESNKAGDMKQFLTYLEKKYFMDMKNYLKNEIGVKVPIGCGGHWNRGHLEIQEEVLDYIDRHAYWDHPTFPGKPWDMNNFRIQNKSIFSNENLGIIGVLKYKPSIPKPRILSEWNHCYPNQYAFETPLFLANEANKNNWDALFQFAFAHSWDINKTFDDIHSYFDINSNAQQLILCSFASRILLSDVTAKVKIQPTFEINKECAIIKYGNYTIKVGPIKNTNSSWDASSRFNWGIAPTLIKICKGATPSSCSTHN
jgi:hypothetical protein